jgi:outer membrane biosynthesis protein TonB
VVLESPHPILSLAAAEAVSAWRYRPAAVDGDTVGVYYTVRLDFRAE